MNVPTMTNKQADKILQEINNTLPTNKGTSVWIEDFDASNQHSLGLEKVGKVLFITIAKKAESNEWINYDFVHQFGVEFETLVKALEFIDLADE